MQDTTSSQISEGNNPGGSEWANNKLLEVVNSLGELGLKKFIPPILNHVGAMIKDGQLILSEICSGPVDEAVGEFLHLHELAVGEYTAPYGAGLLRIIPDFLDGVSAPSILTWLYSYTFSQRVTPNLAHYFNNDYLSNENLIKGHKKIIEKGGRFLDLIQSPLAKPSPLALLLYNLLMAPDFLSDQTDPGGPSFMGISSKSGVDRLGIQVDRDNFPCDSEALRKALKAYTRQQLIRATAYGIHDGAFYEHPEDDLSIFGDDKDSLRSKLENIIIEDEPSNNTEFELASLDEKIQEVIAVSGDDLIFVRKAIREANVDQIINAIVSGARNIVASNKLLIMGPSSSGKSELMRSICESSNRAIPHEMDKPKNILKESINSRDKNPRSDDVSVVETSGIGVLNNDGDNTLASAQVGPGLIKGMISGLILGNDSTADVEKNWVWAENEMKKILAQYGKRVAYIPDSTWSLVEAAPEKVIGVTTPLQFNEATCKKLAKVIDNLQMIDFDGNRGGKSSSVATLVESLDKCLSFLDPELAELLVFCAKNQINFCPIVFTHGPLDEQIEGSVHGEKMYIKAFLSKIGLKGGLSSDELRRANGTMEYITDHEKDPMQGLLSLAKKFQSLPNNPYAYYLGVGLQNTALAFNHLLVLEKSE